MKTIICYNNFEELCKFIVLEGDYSHLDDTLVNSSEGNDDNNKELTELLYGKDGAGALQVELLNNFPLDLVRHEPTITIINCGWIP